MTEEDLEESVPQNQLAIIVKESELSEDKSSVLMSKFASFFVDVQVWEKKAKAIVVKDESQKVIMDQARQGRLFIRKVRLDIEKCRKELKEQSLREGKAIDKVSNFLKDALEPIETHLDKQEHFVEYREAEKEALVRSEVERKLEEQRIEEEKRKAEELEVTRRENEKLRKEAEERNKREEESRRAAEEIIKKEREKVESLEKSIRDKRIAEDKAAAEVQRKALQLKAASDVVKLQKLLEDVSSIQYPDTVSTESKKVVMESRNHIGVAKTMINKYIQSKQLNEEEL